MELRHGLYRITIGTAGYCHWDYMEYRDYMDYMDLNTQEQPSNNTQLVRPLHYLQTAISRMASPDPFYFPDIPLMVREFRASRGYYTVGPSAIGTIRHYHKGYKELP